MTDLSKAKINHVQNNVTIASRFCKCNNVNLLAVELQTLAYC